MATVDLNIEVQARLFELGVADAERAAVDHKVARAAADAAISNAANALRMQQAFDQKRQRDDQLIGANPEDFFSPEGAAACADFLSILEKTDFAGSMGLRRSQLPPPPNGDARVIMPTGDCSEPPTILHGYPIGYYDLTDTKCKLRNKAGQDLKPEPNDRFILRGGELASHEMKTMFLCTDGKLRAYQAVYRPKQRDQHYGLYYHIDGSPLHVLEDLPLTSDARYRKQPSFGVFAPMTLEQDATHVFSNGLAGTSHGHGGHGHGSDEKQYYSFRAKTLEEVLIATAAEALLDYSPPAPATGWTIITP